MSILVNYADGGYRSFQSRLMRKCQEVRQRCLLFDESHGFVSHDVIPYAFKVESMRRALHLTDTVLWVDAPVYPSGFLGLESLFEHIKAKGYLFKDSGFRNSAWCNDRSLAAFGFTRDEAEQQKHVETCILGVSVSHPMGRLVWNEFSGNTDLFKGSWINSNERESRDIRCQGHRHDQSVISLIAAKYHLEVLDVVSLGWFKFGSDLGYVLNYQRDQ
jgi:hypothetical protein